MAWSLLDRFFKPSPRAVLARCKRYEDAGEHAKALEALDALLDRGFRDFDGRILRERRASILVKIGRFEDAEDTFWDFMAEGRKLGFPIASTTWMYQWLLCQYKGDKSKATKVFASLDEDEASKLLDRGSVNPPDAVPEVATAVAGGAVAERANPPESIPLPKPSAEQIQSWLKEAGELSRKWPTLESAVRKYSDVIAGSPECIEAYRGRAACLSTLFKSDDALRDYSFIIAKLPDDADGYYERAQCLRSMSRFSDARSDIEAVLRLKPDDARAMWLRGKVHEDMKEHELAIEDATRAIALDPDYYDAWLLRGRCLFELKRFDEAEPVLRRCKQINPGILNPDRLLEDIQKQRRQATLKPLDCKLGRSVDSADMAVIREALAACTALSEEEVDGRTRRLEQEPLVADLEGICARLQESLRRDFTHPNFVEATVRWNKDTYKYCEVLCFYKASNPSGGLFVEHTVARAADDRYCLWYTQRR